MLDKVESKIKNIFFLQVITFIVLLISTLEKVRSRVKERWLDASFHIYSNLISGEELIEIFMQRKSTNHIDKV